MTCDEARRAIPFILYAELSFEEEEAAHGHFDQCEACRAELDSERKLHQVLEERELEVSSALLRRSRDQLTHSLAAERVGGGSFVRRWMEVKQTFGLGGWVPSVARPASGFALVALGFFAARFIPPVSSNGMQASLMTPSNSRVRYVEPGAPGNVQLIVDETRQRVISGRLDDSNIRALLLSAAKDPSDPGLRVESVDILKSRTASGDVRKALVYALQHDANPGVRLKAMEGLKQYASQPDVCKALSHVLLTDDNPGMRIQAIDLLTQNSNEQRVVGVLQELMRKEENGYIRLRCEKALRGMKASVDTY